MEQIAVKITEDDSNNLIERNAEHGNLLSFPGTTFVLHSSTRQKFRGTDLKDEIAPPPPSMAR